MERRLHDPFPRGETEVKGERLLKNIWLDSMIEWYEEKTRCFYMSFIRSKPTVVYENIKRDTEMYKWFLPRIRETN